MELVVMDSYTEVSESPWQRKKHRAYEIADGIRTRLRALLGGKCKVCGRTEDLEFHHPHGRQWEPRRTNLRHRMRLYQRDFEAGLLELWCKTCNGTDGQARARFYIEQKYGRGQRPDEDGNEAVIR